MTTKTPLGITDVVLRDAHQSILTFISISFIPNFHPFAHTRSNKSYGRIGNSVAIKIDQDSCNRDRC